MTSPVFYAPKLAAECGSQLVLSGPEARHAHVMRLAPGQRIDLVDGRGRRATCRIERWDGNDCVLTCQEVADERTRRRLILVQALAKGGRDEQAVESTTEIGAHHFVPWQSNRAVVKATGKSDKLVAKWESTAMAAMKQSRRAHLPTVAPVVTTKQLIPLVREASEKGATVLVLHESGKPEFGKLLGPDPSELWVIVGPEGGIDDAELAALEEAGARATRLGPTVLRAATAGFAALAAASAMLGDWN